MLQQGADILDIGACSTRPFAAEVSETEEMTRLRDALSVIRSVFPTACLSVDTYRANVARMCVEEFGVDAESNYVEIGVVQAIKERPLYLFRVILITIPTNNW